MIPRVPHRIETLGNLKRQSSLREPLNITGKWLTKVIRLDNTNSTQPFDSESEREIC